MKKACFPADKRFLWPRPEARRKNGRSPRSVDRGSLIPALDMTEKRHCVCGKDYWPSQEWIHEGCAVPVVVNTSDVVVVNRNRDRHKKGPERAAYMREYMRKRRGTG